MMRPPPSICSLRSNATAVRARSPLTAAYGTRSLRIRNGGGAGCEAQGRSSHRPGSRERLWARPAVARAGSERLHVGEDARLPAPVDPKASGYHRQGWVENTFFRYKSHHRRWSSRPESSRAQGSPGRPMAAEILNRMTALVVCTSSVVSHRPDEDPVYGGHRAEDQ